MIDVWYVLPLAKTYPEENSIHAWKALGYKICVLGEKNHILSDKYIRILDSDYIGTPWAINKCIELLSQKGAKIFVCGGHDLYPDEKRPLEGILEQYQSAFPNYEGILEPIKGKNDSEMTILGNPYVGINFYKAHGMYPEHYEHFFADRELYITSKRLGLLYEAKDIEFIHKHWTKEGKPRPLHMNKHYAKHPEDKATFERRLAAGFPR